MSRRIATMAALAALASAIPAASQYRDSPDRGYGTSGRDDRNRGGGAGATFFADDDFSGRSIYLDRPVPRLGELGMEDNISSIDLRGGGWLVCTDDNFRGRCETIDRPTRRLSRIGLDDTISSVRPLDDGGYGGRYDGGSGYGDRGGDGRGGGRYGDGRDRGASYPSSRQLPPGSWAGSCRDARMQGSVLIAECKGAGAQRRTTQLDIRTCSTGGAGNAYGQLVCE